MDSRTGKKIRMGRIFNDEAVAKDVPAADFLPIGPHEAAPQKVGRLIDPDGTKVVRSFGSRPHRAAGKKCICTAGAIAASRR